MKRVVVVAAVALSFLAPRIADACSCPRPTPYIMPRPATVDVPVNARPLILNVAAAEIEVTLSDGTNDIAFTLDDSVGGRIAVVPSSLAPDTTYTLSVTAPSYGEPATTSSSFTTGTRSDTVAEPFGGLTVWSPERMQYPITDCFSSCISTNDGHLSRLRVAMATVPVDAAAIVIEMGEAWNGRMTFEPRAFASMQLLEPDGCSGNYFQFMNAVEPTCGRAYVVDVAGNISESEALCTEVTSCAPVGTDASGCEPARTCTPMTSVSGSDGGCATSSPSPSWLVVLAMGLLVRRRRAS